VTSFSPLTAVAVSHVQVLPRLFTFRSASSGDSSSAKATPGAAGAAGAVGEPVASGDATQPPTPIVGGRKPTMEEVRVCVRACVFACVCACVCVRSCVRACVRVLLTEVTHSHELSLPPCCLCAAQRVHPQLAEGHAVRVAVREPRAVCQHVAWWHLASALPHQRRVCNERCVEGQCNAHCERWCRDGHTCVAAVQDSTSTLPTTCLSADRTSLPVSVSVS
jgi:hypothetical protein